MPRPHAGPAFCHVRADAARNAQSVLQPCVRYPGSRRWQSWATAALLALDALAPAPVRTGLSAREAELCRRWGIRMYSSAIAAISP